MDDGVVKLSEHRRVFLKDLLQKAVRFMVEVQVVNDSKGTYFVQYPTVAEGYPYVEKFVSNSPFYVNALLKEVDRLREDLRWVKDRATDKGASEQLLSDIDKYVGDSLKEPEDHGEASA
jgi:hypothetical protein